MLERLNQRARKASQILVWIAGTSLIGAALIVTVDVVTRKLLSITMAGADEISGYVFAISTSFSLSYALLHRVNIRIDAGYQHFPRGLRVLADFAALVLLVGFLAVVAYLGWDLVSESFRYGSRSITPLRTPIAWPQAAWLGGIVVCVLSGVLVLVSALAALASRDYHRVHMLIGVKSVDEQIREEVGGSAEAGDPPPRAGAEE